MNGEVLEPPIILTEDERAILGVPETIEHIPISQAHLVVELARQARDANLAREVDEALTPNEVFRFYDVPIENRQRAAVAVAVAHRLRPYVSPEAEKALQSEAETAVQADYPPSYYGLAG